MNTIVTYPEFKYKESEIKRYIEAVGLFSILLDNRKTVHFTPGVQRGKVAHKTNYKVKSHRQKFHYQE